MTSVREHFAGVSAFSGRVLAREGKFDNQLNRRYRENELLECTYSHARGSLHTLPLHLYLWGLFGLVRFDGRPDMRKTNLLGLRKDNVFLGSAYIIIFTRSHGVIPGMSAHVGR